jgi:hypothetical protein
MSSNLRSLKLKVENAIKNPNVSEQGKERLREILESLIDMMSFGTNVNNLNTNKQALTEINREVSTLLQEQPITSFTNDTQSYKKYQPITPNNNNDTKFKKTQRLEIFKTADRIKKINMIEQAFNYVITNKLKHPEVYEEGPTLNYLYRTRKMFDIIKTSDTIEEDKKNKFYEFIYNMLLIFIGIYNEYGFKIESEAEKKNREDKEQSYENSYKGKFVEDVKGELTTVLEDLEYFSAKNPSGGSKSKKSRKSKRKHRKSSKSKSKSKSRKTRK